MQMKDNVLASGQLPQQPTTFNTTTSEVILIFSREQYYAEKAIREGGSCELKLNATLSDDMNKCVRGNALLTKARDGMELNVRLLTSGGIKYPFTKEDCKKTKIEELLDQSSSPLKLVIYEAEIYKSDGVYEEF